MKKGFGLTLIFLVFLLPISALAFQNEPDGFRGIEWGTDISEWPDMTHVSENVYQRENDELTIGDANVKKIHYKTYEGRLWGVSITYEDYNNHEKLKQTFFYLYGEADYSNRLTERYHWHGSDIWISLHYSEGLDWGSISYRYQLLREDRR